MLSILPIFGDLFYAIPVNIFIQTRLCFFVIQVVLSIVCVAISTSYAGILHHGLENHLEAPAPYPAAIDVQAHALHDHVHSLQHASHALQEVHQQHFAPAPQLVHSAPALVHHAPAPAPLAIEHSAPALAVHHAAPSYAVQHAAPAVAVHHAAPAVIHQGPAALSPLGDAHLQGHAVNGHVVSEQVVSGQLEGGALVSHSHGPVTIVRVSNQSIFIGFIEFKTANELSQMPS